MAVSEEQTGLEFKQGQRGQDDAAAHLGERECAVLEAWTREIADLRGDEGFTADDVRSALPVWVTAKLEVAPNAMGALFRRLAKARVIERAPDKAARVATHRGSRGRTQPVWRKVRTEDVP